MSKTSRSVPTLSGPLRLVPRAPHTAALQVAPWALPALPTAKMALRFQRVFSAGSAAKISASTHWLRPALVVVFSASSPAIHRMGW